MSDERKKDEGKKHAGDSSKGGQSDDPKTGSSQSKVQQQNQSMSSVQGTDSRRRGATSQGAPQENKSKKASPRQPGEGTSRQGEQSDGPNSDHSAGTKSGSSTSIALKIRLDHFPPRADPQGSVSNASSSQAPGPVHSPPIKMDHVTSRKENKSKKASPRQPGEGTSRQGQAQNQRFSVYFTVKWEEQKQQASTPMAARVGIAVFDESGKRKAILAVSVLAKSKREANVLALLNAIKFLKNAVKLDLKVDAMEVTFHTADYGNELCSIIGNRPTDPHERELRQSWSGFTSAIISDMDSDEKKEEVDNLAGRLE